MALQTDTVDCGAGSTWYVWNTSTSVQAVIIDSGKLIYGVQPLHTQSLPCSGSHQIRYETTAVGWTTYTDVNRLMGENMLLGLGGIVCGLLIAWALTKAVR